MNLIFRLRKHSIALLPKFQNPAWVHCTFAQAAHQQVEEVEIDPRKLPADYDSSKFDPTSHRSCPSDRVFKLVDEVSSLTLSKAAELGKVLMNKMGMKEDEVPVVGVLNPSAAAGLAQMAANSGSTIGNDQEAKKEEKSVFELKLESFEATFKLKVIKEIRSFTDLGFKEAKDLVEKTPLIFKSGVPKDEAEAIIEKMKAAGAKVVME